MLKIHRLAALFAIFYGAAVAANGVTQQRIPDDSVTGSFRWIMDTPSSLRFQLVQRIPDQTRSFYNARGFSLEAANKYATACVMQTIFNNNSSDRTVAFDLADWRIVHETRSRPLKLTSEWQADWERLNVSQSGRIAFQWSQFPNVQKHGPGDWFQGMIAAELPPAAIFDLELHWTENGAARSATMKNIQCAEDRNLGDDT